MAAHLVTCPECRRLAAAYRQAVAAGRAETELPLPEVAGFPDVVDRIEGRSRRTLAWAALPAAAALAAIVWISWPAMEPAPPQPQPIAASGSVPPAPPLSDSTTTVGLRPPSAVPVPNGLPVIAPGQGLDLADPANARLYLAPFARVRTEAWSPARSILALDTGTVTADVLPRPPGGLFEVRTEFAVVRVVGTRFTVTHRPGIDTEVACHEGKVGVLAPGRPEVAFLAAGESMRLGPGLAVGAPVLPVARMPSPSAPTRAATNVASVPATPSVAVDPAEILARARWLLAEGRAAEAAALVETALKTAGPARGRLLAVQGDALRMAGHLEPARDTYQRALAAGAPDGVAADLASMLRLPMGQGAEAVAVWRNYLVESPRGRYADQAWWEIAARHEAQGDGAQALAAWGRLVDDHPGSPHAVRALVLGGRHLAETGDLERAAAWYISRRGHARPDIAEAALAGLIGVRARQGRAEDVAALAAEHARRFPDGAHRDEVRLVAP
jgi:hypothetical protein